MNTPSLRVAGLLALLLSACPGGGGEPNSGPDASGQTSDGSGGRDAAEADAGSGVDASDGGLEPGAEDAGAVLAPPPLSRMEETPFSEANGFLLEGQGIAGAGIIDPTRMAVLHGRVLERGGGPIVGVRVFAPLHPEWGSVSTREDGEYDLAVNGGGDVLVGYSLTGY